MNSVSDAHAFRKVARVVLSYVPILSCAMLVGACGQTQGGIREVSWAESVEVSDGTRVDVARRVRFTVGRAVGEKLPAVDRFVMSTLAITDADLKASLFDAKRVIPIVLRRDSGASDLVLITTTDDCDIWVLNGKPIPAYWAFRLHEGVWYRTALSSSMYGTSRNLLTDIRLHDERELSKQEVNERKSANAGMQFNLSYFQRILPDAVVANCKNVGAPNGTDDFSQLGSM